MAQQPSRSNDRILPIDRYIGVATQFERDGRDFLFRHRGSGPACRVGSLERDAFVAAGRRAAILHFVAMILTGWAACLVVARAMAGWSATAVAIGNGVALSLIAMALYASLRWYADAPARTLSDRPIEAPARAPRYGERLGYVAIVVLTVLLLMLAALGTRTPSSDYVTFATMSVMLGLYLAIDRWRFMAAIGPARRVEVKAEERKRNREAADQAPSGWAFLAVLIFLLIEMAIGAIVVGCGFAAAAAMSGSTLEGVSGGTAAVAIVLSLCVAALVIWPIEKLCCRLTGMSAIDTFDFIPPSW